MKQISVNSLKGGSGKTTLSFNIAYYLLVKESKKIALVNLDYQKSINNIYNDFNEKIISTYKTNIDLFNNIEELEKALKKGKYDYVIYDTRPNFEKEYIESVFDACDLNIVVFEVDNLNFDTNIELLDISPKNTVFVFNKVNKNDLSEVKELESFVFKRNGVKKAHYLSNRNTYKIYPNRFLFYYLPNQKHLFKKAHEEFNSFMEDLKRSLK